MKFIDEVIGLQNFMFSDEHANYQVDFSNALWATSEIHNLYHSSGLGHFLYDVDFLVETENYFLFLEYKNGNASKIPDKSMFDPTRADSILKIVRKFYDSLHYLAMRRNKKPVKYVYIVEAPRADKFTRYNIYKRVAKSLPFRLQEKQQVKLIDGFEVLSIEEWNSHAEYAQYPLTKIE